MCQKGFFVENIFCENKLWIELWAGLQAEEQWKGAQYQIAGKLTIPCPGISISNIADILNISNISIVKYRYCKYDNYQIESNLTIIMCLNNLINMYLYICLICQPPVLVFSISQDSSESFPRQNKAGEVFNPEL